MNSEQDLINKLIISKKIMEKHNEIGRGGVSQPTNINTEEIYEPQQVRAKYNVPQEFLNENDVKIQSNVSQGTTEERIKNSRLPDEIKKLMMEHPIEQPTMGNGGVTLSSDLIEKASRLMGTNKNPTTSQNSTPIQKQQTTNVSINYNEIRDIVKETVEDVLKENGLLVESTTKSNEIFKFRVGNHIFEGKLTNIKKINK